MEEARQHPAVTVAAGIADAVPEIEFERTSCMLCGSRDSLEADSLRWRGAELRYRICRGCGLKYMSPRPTERWYQAFYAREFWQLKTGGVHWTGRLLSRLAWLWRSSETGRLRKLRGRFAALEPMLAEHARLGSHSRVLEIGCGFGAILAAVRARWGAAVAAVEPSELARSHAARRFGAEIIGETAEDLIGLRDYDGAFDLIILSNVLENIVRPKAVLGACRRLLSGNGLLLIDTPNFFYYNAVNPFHPYIYSPATLALLIAHSGSRSPPAATRLRPAVATVHWCRNRAAGSGFSRFWRDRAPRHRRTPGPWTRRHWSPSRQPRSPCAGRREPAARRC